MGLNGPSGEIIQSWDDSGHRFQIERLKEPIKIGAAIRNYRLWQDGRPATGGQWHETIENAKERANYVALGTVHQRLRHLETIVFGKPSLEQSQAMIEDYRKRWYEDQAIF